MPPEPSTTPHSSPGNERRRSLLAAALVSATWIACVIALDGMLDLVFDLPVVREHDVGALFEPSVVLFAAALLFLRLFVGVRPGGRTVVLLALDGFLLVFFGQVVASAFAVALDRRSPGMGVLAIVREASAPGTAATAIAAAGCAALFAWLVAHEHRLDSATGRPRDGGPGGTE